MFHLTTSDRCASLSFHTQFAHLGLSCGTPVYGPKVLSVSSRYARGLGKRPIRELRYRRLRVGVLIHLELVQ
jgi:hypothetical protein